MCWRVGRLEVWQVGRWEEWKAGRSGHSTDWCWWGLATLAKGGHIVVGLTEETLINKDHYDLSADIGNSLGFSIGSFSSFFLRLG